jgi:hypothetical protein
MSGCEATDEVKSLIRQMANAKLEEGVTDAHDIVDAIHDAISEHTPLWKNEIADIISGYGQKRSSTATKSDLQQRILQLKRDLKEAYHPKQPPKTPEERKNTTRQTQIKKEIGELQEKLRTGNFSKQPKKGFEYDPVTQKLQAQLEGARRQVDREMRRQEYANRSTVAKVADTFLAFHRAMILSGLGTLEHLTGASLSRLIFTPIEDVAGGLLHHVPGIRSISEKAPTEGGGFDTGALLHTYGKTFNKATLRDMADKVTRGFSDLQAAMKDPYDSHHKILDMVGHIHDALKTPAERFAYEKALVNQAHQMRKELARGGMAPDEIDRQMQSPVTVAQAQARAYEAALRAKLQGDNKLINGYKRLMATLSPDGKGVVAATANYLLPIVKIPVNLADEVISYAAGELRAAYTGARAGKNMDPEIADYIMRNLKKGAVGKVLMVIAWLGAGAFGGDYDESRRRRPGEPQYGDIQVGGHTVPKELLHAPAFALMQATATARKVYDAEIAKEVRKHQDVDKGEAAGTAAAHGAMAVANTIPFIESATDIAKAMESGHAISDYAGRLAAQNEPQAMKDIAKATDPEKALERKPSGFVQEMEVGVPGLRERVPLKSLKGMSLDDKLDAYEKMSQAERDKSGIVESIMTTAEHSRSMTPEQQKRVDAIQ